MISRLITSRDLATEVTLNLYDIGRFVLSIHIVVNHRVKNNIGGKKVHNNEGFDVILR